MLQVQYLLCYACAGSQFQICAMQRGSSEAYRFRRPLSLVTLEDRLQIILLAVHSYWIMKAQLQQLPPVLLLVGRTEYTTFSKVEFFDSFVQKRITFSNDSWPQTRCNLMEGIYAASKECPFLMHAQDPPHASQNGQEYVVDLEPVGQPVYCKHFDHRPRSSRDLKNSIRCATSLAMSGSRLAMAGSVVMLALHLIRLISTAEVEVCYWHQASCIAC